MMAQVYVFFLAGFETTASALSFALYEIAKNPEIQNKLQNDIDTVLQKYEGSWSSQCFSEMKYLNQVCCETLRKYPSAPIIVRRAERDWKIPDNNFTIKKNTLAYISIYSIHHDPQYYSEPEKFDPDRFLPENVQNRIPFTYLPFGDGPKMCIGARMGILKVKIGIVAVLSKFRIELVADGGRQVFSDEAAMINIKDDMKVKIIPRI